MIGRVTAGMLALAIAAAEARTATAESLDDLRWKKRVVLLFSPADADAGDAASALLGDEAGLAERDLVILEIRGDTMRSLIGSEVSRETAAGLRARFGVGPSSSAALLIGKDGGVKWRTRQPINRQELFGRIDAMPMRRGREPD